MVFALDDLRPFVSLTLGHVSRARRASIVDEALEEIETILETGPDAGSRSSYDIAAAAQDGSLWVGFLQYIEQRRPAWLSAEAAVRDRIHHLVLACRRDQHLAIFASDPAVRRRVASRMRKGEGVLGEIRPIEAGVLNAAFAEGPARTLWLSGIHRRTPSKPDSKILSGLALRSALQPLEDQSYVFTAARCVAELPGLPPHQQSLPVGLTPGRSRIWSGPARDWEEFRDRVFALLGRVKNVQNPTVSPFPILASPAVSLADIGSAYDVSVIAPEILLDDVLAEADLGEIANRWSHESNLEVVDQDGANFTATVEVGGIALGSARFEVAIDDGGRVSWTIGWEGDTEDADLRKEAGSVLSRPRWVTIRYESGHTLRDGAVYSVRHRDQPFRGWQFVALAEYAVKKEKPGDGHAIDPDLIGKEDSLFCWCQNHWPDLSGDGAVTGWLASDDGAGEIADFIHFDPEAGDSGRLTLIHVKGSKTDNPNRQISTSDYEIVVGQAIKNLRSLDGINLADRLRAGMGKKIASAVWFEGERQDDRTGMIEALENHGTNYDRRVVILQPHVTKSEHDRARQDQEAGQASARVQRMQQLDTLLVGAAADCAALGADLLVIGEDGGEDSHARDGIGRTGHRHGYLTSPGSASTGPSSSVEW